MSVCGRALQARAGLTLRVCQELLSTGHINITHASRRSTSTQAGESAHRAQDRTALMVRGRSRDVLVDDARKQVVVCLLQESF